MGNETSKSAIKPKPKPKSGSESKPNQVQHSQHKDNLNYQVAMYSTAPPATMDQQIAQHAYNNRNNGGNSNTPFK
jgi:hypothetical protein